ncbi:hypothetical protein OG21DRAFT_1524539 [Imleria badia]|nr:hypothetical protein OG21DRAFT_1524539 [Imleria badia]
MVVSPYAIQPNSAYSGTMGNNIASPRSYDHVPLPELPGEADVGLESTNTPYSPGQSDSPCLEPTHSPFTSRASDTEQRKEVADVYTPNVVIFGETGVGKSSIINLIADQTLARTSNGALGCTFQHVRYPITLGNVTYALWDTTGLDEGSEGTVPSKLAENNLRELMRGLERSGGIHLIIYCIRGTRLTKALKRNYDLFYVTVCRKKVPVALVVTGLENQQGEMEMWWTTNETTLRQNGMRFDAHACVTTLNVEDPVIQQRRSDSRSLLRELVVKYSELPAWKIDPSFISRVFPVFHSIFHGTSSTGNLRNTTTIRNVIVCGFSAEFLPGTTATWVKSTGSIGNRQYEFLRVDKHALHTLTPRTLEDVGGVGAGVLVFYTSAMVHNRITPTDVDALKRFYDCAGGQICPMIVVLQGCDDEKIAQACCVQVTSRHSDIHAHFVSLPHTDDARTKLDEMIESLCIEQVEVKTRNFFRRYMASNRFLATFVDGSFQ